MNINMNEYMSNCYYRLSVKSDSYYQLSIKQFKGVLFIK